MRTNYLVHERQYQEARAKGWSGWGGDARMALEHILIGRLFSYPNVPQSGRALELGCGEGHYCRILAERGYTVTGVDISDSAIAWAKEKTAPTGLSITYHQADLSQPGILPNGNFDLIVDGNCFHCIIGQDRQAFLANVHRLLSDDGVFFISSKCIDSGDDEIIEFEGKPYRYVPSQDTMRNELEAAGFEIKQFEFHFEAGRPHNHSTVHLIKQ